MSDPQLVTIDFLGIGTDETATENISSAMDCHRQVMKRRGIQACLGKIKPHMLQQVLSDGYLSNPEHSQRELHCGVSEDSKTMELFPKKSPGSRSDSKDGQKPFPDTQFNLSETAAAAFNFEPPSKPSSSQLMLLYDGAAYLYGDVSADKAKAIMAMAAGNGNTENISNCAPLSKGLRESVPSQEGSTNQRYPLGISHWKLPIAKKKSLQRFLQKRKAG